MSRANEFLRLYNEIDTFLRELVKADRYDGFKDVVRTVARQNSAVRMNQSSLIGFGELRNAIVHDRRFPDEIIAEPREDAVEEFRQIVRQITSPPRLIPTFQKEVKLFAPNDQLLEALEYMRRRDYSQVLVQDRPGLNLLTTEGIARWLEQQAEEDIISVQDTAIAAVLGEQALGGFEVVSRETTVFDANDHFLRLPAERQSRLFALIITHSGKPTEKPLGIVTPWDLLEFEADKCE